MAEAGVSNSCTKSLIRYSGSHTSFFLASRKLALPRYLAGISHLYLAAASLLPYIAFPPTSGL